MSRTTAGGTKLLVLLVTAVFTGGCISSGGSETTSTLNASTTMRPPTESTSTVSTTSTAPETTITTTSSSTTTTIGGSTTTTPRVGAARVVSRVDTNERVIALTFDAGSDRGFGAEILDTLAAHEVKATFGMTGTWAESNPDLLRRIVDEGHGLMNHTYDHPHMETLAPAQRLDQLARAETIIQEITGTTTKPYFRPPYGSYNNRVLNDLGSAGYRYSVMWTVDCLGWKGLPPPEVAARCESALQPGAILLMHVGSASTDYAALEDIIAAIDQGGYRYATISELLP